MWEFESDEHVKQKWNLHFDEKNSILFASICDVTGHGVSSAIVTAVLHGTFQGQMRNGENQDILEW